MTIRGRAPPAGRDEIIGAETLEGLEVEERLRDGALRLTRWEVRDPTVVCGITTPALGDYVVGGAPPVRVTKRYAELARRLGFDRVSVPAQIHGTQIREAATRSEGRGAVPRVERAGRIDGQVTSARGCLLAATAADCVPVSLWNPVAGRIGLVHAGWRGASAGILRRALPRLLTGAGGPIGDLRVHFGPAICGRCYEVDTPVLEAFGVAGDRARLDLRGLLAAQALDAGVERAAISTSRHCTVCGPIRLHSHRGSGGEAGRMAAFLGLLRD